MTRSPEALRDWIPEYFTDNLITGSLGVAVSGGSDSLALLVLLHDWMQAGGPDLQVVTVDHGLRHEAADEAAYVGRICAQLGLAHRILDWRGWDGQGNLPDQARRARYALMVDWAAPRRISHIALGHTVDDQAETFLMRLAREAGVDGLSAMVPDWRQGAVTFCRPVLGLTRAELQGVLRARAISWVDDPSNDDTRYDRVKARKALADLRDLGITAQGLGHVARHMGHMRDTLYWYVERAARDFVTLPMGDVVIERAGFESLPREVARRLMQEALKWVSSAEYGPRGRALDLLLGAIRDGADTTLHGCLLSVGRDQLRVSREAKAVAGLRVPSGDIWDGRWTLEGPGTEAAEIRALGQTGLAQCPDWRETGLPEASLRAGPAVWSGGELLAAPLAGLENGWTVRLLHNQNHVFAALLSH